MNGDRLSELVAIDLKVEFPGIGQQKKLPDLFEIRPVESRQELVQMVSEQSKVLVNLAHMRWGGNPPEN